MGPWVSVFTLDRWPLCDASYAGGAATQELSAQYLGPFLGTWTL